MTAETLAPTRVRILNTEPGRFSPTAKTALRALGDVDEVEVDRDYLLDHAVDYDVLFVALRNVIDQAVLDRADRLKCIVTPTTGTDHVDVECARSKGVALLTLQGETEFLRDITATAELAWGLLLAVVRRVPAAHQSVMCGQWVRDRFCGLELKGKVLGVVGYGRLGRMVAEYGKAFRMDVVACDRQPARRQDGIEFVALHELLRRADVVSVHLPLNDETRGLFDKEKFSLMKHGAVFINTARGAIVDETVLVEALRSGRLSAAAVDVLADETSLDAGWLDASPLRAYATTHENVVMTPHIGGVTGDSVEATNLFMIAKLGEYLRGRV